MAPSVCFILGELGPSGGAGAVVRHARGLAEHHGCDVSIAVWGDPGRSAAPPGVAVVSLDEARSREHDVAIATWWRTAFDLMSVPARRHAYFVQQFEERVYRPGDVERIGAMATHDLPVAFLTEARWIADELAALRADAACFHVPNGIDKACFQPGGSATDADGVAGDRPLRVLVEGSPGLWFKGIQEAAAVLELTREPVATTLVTPERVDRATCDRFDTVLGPLDPDGMADAYRNADVLLKLSRVEGVFTPPLEAFQCGTPCVVWPVTGHDELVRHGVNGAVTDFDDLVGTAGWIDLLARDRELLGRLGGGALATAAEWPSWERSTAGFAEALGQIAAAPQPAAGAGAGRMLADLELAMEQQRLIHQHAERASLAADSALASAEREIGWMRERLAGIEASRIWRTRETLNRLRRR